MSNDVKLSDIVQAYQAREDARRAHSLALAGDDRSYVVGIEQAREARSEVVRTARESAAAERKLEDLLWLARAEALAREG